MSKHQRNPGRVRIRLCALLLAKGIIVAPEDLWTQEGGYRSFHWDLARWGTHEAKFVNGIAPDGKPWPHKVQLASWSTMTSCVKYGVDIGKEDQFGGWGEVAVENNKQPEKAQLA